MKKLGITGDEVNKALLNNLDVKLRYPRNKKDSLKTFKIIAQKKLENTPEDIRVILYKRANKRKIKAMERFDFYKNFTLVS